MTLAEVASRIRRGIRQISRDKEEQARYEQALESMVRMFESDPDFTLRERLEAELDSASITKNPKVGCVSVERLRELLEGKA